MTRMSEPHSALSACPVRKLSQSHGGSPLARSVQSPRSPVGTVLSLTLLPTLVGCVIPPSLRIDDGASVNSPPAILSITSDQSALAEPGPVLFERGDTAGNVRVTLIDTDEADTLYVRIFVDYNLPDRLPARVACTAGAPSEDATRIATCDVTGLCATSDIGVQRNMTVVVFDRLPSDFGEDPQAMPEGGLSTTRFYFLSCQLPQT